MAGNDDLTRAREVLVDMRSNRVKAIAAGYKRGETEDAIKALLEVQQAIDVIDHAIEEEQDLSGDDEFDDE
jgi:hypothetical protein